MSSQEEKLVLFTVLLLGVVVRLDISLWTRHADVTFNGQVGRHVLHQGADSVYSTKFEYGVGKYELLDQPPGSVYLWSFSQFLMEKTTSLWAGTELGSMAVENVYYKLPFILGDMLLTLLAFWFLRDERPLVRIGSLLFWAFNPILIHQSGVWGQYDSLVSFLSYAGLTALLLNSILLGVVLFGLSLFTKVSPIILIPPVGLYLVKVKVDLRQLGWAFISLVGILSVLLIPLKKNIVWLVNFIVNAPTHSRTYITANATNFWGMFYHPNGFFGDQVLFGPMKAAYLGMGAFVFGYMLILIVLWQRKDDLSKLIFPAATLITYAAFLFLPRMHERYLFPALFPLFVWAIQFRSKGVLLAFLMVNLLFFLNLYFVFPLGRSGFQGLVDLYWGKVWYLPALIGLGHLVVFVDLVRRFVNLSNQPALVKRELLG